MNDQHHQFQQGAPVTPAPAEKRGQAEVPGESFVFPPAALPATLTPAQLTGLAQAHFAAALPYHAAPPCPSSAAWKAFVQSGGSLPDQAQRAHLFDCAECFVVYRNAMMQRPQPRVLFVRGLAARWQSWRETFASSVGFSWPQVTLAALFALITVGLGGWLSWRQVGAPTFLAGELKPASSAPTSIPTHGSAPLPVDVPASAAARTAVATAQLPAALQTQTSPPSVKLPTVSLDLAEYVLLRDVNAGQPEQRQISLPRARLRLHLRLPEGSLPGRYRLQFRSLAGAAVPLSVAASSRDGLRLNLQLDLRTIPAGRGELVLQHADEPPYHYQVHLQP